MIQDVAFIFPVNSASKKTRNLAIANRSRVSCAIRRGHP